LCFGHNFSPLPAGEMLRFLRFPVIANKLAQGPSEGSLVALSPKKRGAKPQARNPLEPKVRELEAKVTRLEKELHKAHTILDVQEKVAGLLGFDLGSGKNS